MPTSPQLQSYQPCSINSSLIFTFNKKTKPKMKDKKEKKEHNTQEGKKARQKKYKET